jgi:hypothetical protein
VSGVGAGLGDLAPAGVGVGDGAAVGKVDGVVAAAAIEGATEATDWDEFAAPIEQAPSSSISNDRTTGRTGRRMLLERPGLIERYGWRI